jgi:hypothetical protein
VGHAVDEEEQRRPQQAVKDPPHALAEQERPLRRKLTDGVGGGEPLAWDEVGEGGADRRLEEGSHGPHQDPHDEQQRDHRGGRAPPREHEQGEAGHGEAADDVGDDGDPDAGEAVGDGAPHGAEQDPGQGGGGQQ